MPLFRVQGAQRRLTQVVIEGSAPASLGPDVVVKFFFVVGKEVCSLLPRLFKRETRVKKMDIRNQLSVPRCLEVLPFVC